MKRFLFPFLIWFFYLIMLFMNILANILPINQNYTAKISEKYFSFFTPSGFTFSIWTVIYILCAAYCVHLFRLARNNQLTVFHQSSGILFLISCIINSLWLFAWHYENIPASFMIILVLLYLLTEIYNLCRKHFFSGQDYLFIHLLFSIYTGWIATASAANLSVLLVYYQIPKHTELAVSWIMLMTISIVPLLFLRKDRTLLITIMWFLFGVYANNLSENIKPESVLFRNTALICASAILLTILLPRNAKNKTVRF